MFNAALREKKCSKKGRFFFTKRHKNGRKRANKRDGITTGER
tara:strand:+ start:351 stop:476 length:126 start_codon:yes stop_codon:yes gene_type:complete